MKLPEKILYCRKRAGLSQEALAERIGVSRQAVSKWETGDAVPELGKLLSLAQAFGVTTDWLLSEEEPQEPRYDYTPEPELQKNSEAQDWLDAVPGFIGKMLRRYGWLYGVYLAVAGALFAGIGALARYITRGFFSNDITQVGTSVAGFPSEIFFEGQTYYVDSYGTVLNDGFTNIASKNPVVIMGTVIMVVGLVMMVAGIVLAVVLRRKSRP